MISDLSEIEAALREARKELVALAADIGGCEHDINICQCQLEAVIQQVRIVLEELVVCPKCHNADYAPYMVSICVICGGQGYVEVEINYGQGVELGLE